MSNLYSDNIDEIAEVCIDIYQNPETYQQDRESIVNRLLELPDNHVSYDFEKQKEYGSANYLLNFSLMALISLYRINPQDEIPSSSKIINYFKDFSAGNFGDLFTVSEFKKEFLKFLIEDLSKEYSDENFFQIIEYIFYLREKKDKEIIEILLASIKLIEYWLINSKEDHNIDDKWFFLRYILPDSINVIKEAFTRLIIKLLKKKKFEIISLYSYIEANIMNEDLKSDFKLNMPNSSDIPEMNLFLKAERAYAEKDYSKALKYYSQLPNDFPQIRAIMNNKLRYCCDQVNNYLEMGTYINELIKLVEKL